MTRALVVRQGELLVDTFNECQPSPGEVAVEVLACGICASDASFVSHAADIGALKTHLAESLGPGIYVPDLSRDVFLGHEVCGRISEVGESVPDLTPGTFVVAIPAVEGPLGLVTAAYNNEGCGGLATRMVLPASSVLVVPDGLDPKEASFTEPLTVALHGINRAGITDGDYVVVFGCGPIGLASIALLRHKYDCRIVACEPRSIRRERAVDAGADLALDITENPFAGRPADSRAVALETSGAPGVLATLLDILPHAGQIGVIGACLHPEDQLSRYVGLFKEATISYAMRYQRADLEEALNLIASGAVKPSKWITDVVSLEEAAQLLNGTYGVGDAVKIVVDPRAERRSA